MRIVQSRVSGLQFRLPIAVEEEKRISVRVCLVRAFGSRGR